MSKFKVYVWTSNQLMHCLPAWAFLFNKFWPWFQDVTVLGYNTPDFELPDNFKYVSLGEQRGPQYWSDDIKEFLLKEDVDLFYLTTEDGFIIKPVDESLVNLAISLAITNPGNKFSKFCLTADVQRRPHEVIHQFNGFKLLKAAQGSEYRQSLGHSIWRKDSFINKLKPNQSPWDFELDNAQSMFDGLDVYATCNKYALHPGHGYYKGRKVPNWYENAYYDIDRGHYTDYDKYAMLDEEYIDFINKNEWVPEV